MIDPRIDQRFVNFDPVKTFAKKTVLDSIVIGAILEASSALSSDICTYILEP